jgi:hypothetical protein
MVTEVRYDLPSGNKLVMSKQAEKTDLDEALLSVWRQALVERKKRVRLGDDSYPVQHTAKSKLAQIDFAFAGQRIRGLEQNPATASRWAELARKGAKVMQFLIDGRYIAAVSDGKITRFSRKK